MQFWQHSHLTPVPHRGSGLGVRKAGTPLRKDNGSKNQTADCQKKLITTLPLLPPSAPYSIFNSLIHLKYLVYFTRIGFSPPTFRLVECRLAIEIKTSKRKRVSLPTTLPFPSDLRDWTKLATVATSSSGDSSHFCTICKTQDTGRGLRASPAQPSCTKYLLPLTKKHGGVPGT